MPLNYTLEKYHIKMFVNVCVCFFLLTWWTLAFIWIVTGLSARASILTWWRCAWNIFWFTIFSSISSFAYASAIKERKRWKKIVWNGINSFMKIYSSLWIDLDVYWVQYFIVSLSSNFPFCRRFYVFYFILLCVKWIINDRKGNDYYKTKTE